MSKTIKERALELARACVPEAESELLLSQHGRAVLVGAVADLIAAEMRFVREQAVEKSVATIESQAREIETLKSSRRKAIVSAAGEAIAYGHRVPMSRMYAERIAENIKSLLNEDARAE